MSELVFFLEEPSARARLEGLLPRLLPDRLASISVRYLVFEGKQDLESQLEKRLKGYLVPGARFVILHDKDSENCQDVKERLVEKCRLAAKTNALVRIACHELESWYLADLSAVEKGLELSGVRGKQNRAKFPDPDILANAADELRKLTQGVYQKIAGSRAIGPNLDLENHRSRSFAVFVAGLRRLLTTLEETLD